MFDSIWWIKLKATIRFHLHKPKPHIWKINNDCWYCAGKGVLGIGHGMLDAYTHWSYRDSVPPPTFRYTYE